MPLDGRNYQPCETARILREAANYIKNHGWGQGVQVCFLPESPCINTAIYRVTGTMDLDWNKTNAPIFEKNDIAAKELNRFLREEFNHERSNPDWNDKPERTKEEVIEVLEKAANFAEEKVIA